MFKLLKIERIGSHRLGDRPAFVNEVLGFGPRGLEEMPLKCQVDYSDANSVGSRGVYLYYFLEEDRIYHISAPISWNRLDEYYGLVKAGKIVRLRLEKVIEWLEKNI